MQGFDCVTADAGWYDESLGIVHLEGLEHAFWTLDEGCLAVHKVENIHAAICVVLNRTSEGVSSCLDELVGMQSCPFFLDAFFLMKHFEMVGDLRLDEGCGALPLDDELAALYVDGTRFAVQSESCPVPKFEGKDTGG